MAILSLAALRATISNVALDQYLSLDHLIIATFSTLVTALIIYASYNVFFHPLKDIPGPWIFATCRLPYVWYVLTGQLAVKLHELHEKYGPVVRTASNEISFIGPEAWETIYSRKNAHHREFPKNYDKWNETANSFGHTLFLASDADHPRMRKALAPAFSDGSLRTHLPTLQGHINNFLAAIKTASTNDSGTAYSKPVDLNDWFNFLAFDAVSEFVLGESFNSLKQPDPRVWLRRLSDTWRFISIVSSFKSLGDMKSYLALLLPKKWLQTYVDQLKLVRNAAMTKLNAVLPSQTLMSIAQSKPRERDTDRTRQLYMSDTEVLANAELVVVAGTDTSASALPAIAYLLASHPEAMKKATDEVRAFKTEDDLDFNALSKIPFITACVYEALRLYAPVPEGLPRYVPQGGDEICGYFVPEDVSPQAANISTAHFHEADKFRPDRWMHSDPVASAPYANDVRAAFKPFSAGPRDCIGQNFAMTSIRLTLAKLLYRYDLECATDDNWLSQSCYLLWRRRSLWMNLKPREA